MVKKKRLVGLQLEEDISFQNFYWKFQKVGWVFVVVFLVAAFLGFFGTGILNETAAEDELIEVRYSPYARFMSATSFEIFIPGEIDGETLSFWIEREFLNKYQIQQIVPQPESVTLDGDRVVYEINAHMAEDAGIVTLSLEPRDFGHVVGQIGQEGNAGVELRQFIYP